ncbi:MAG: alanine--tRNA ligase, partial [Gammaproteobacteria bacterium]
ETRPYKRAASAQRCVRAGGKHNDLENVGYTARHHTFFEMLGNFSFGDYFKREAIHYAWEFLTRELEIPAEKLWVTVFEEDDEAAAIWLQEIGVDAARFARIGAEDNFWSMGDTGPCGPCSEIFYDHGPEVAGGPPGTPEADGDRYVEIWNLVFMQYNRDSSGTMTPLPKPSVDTGMGMERLAAVMQGVHSNYDIDLFRNLIQAMARLARCDDLQHPSLRVIADHIRSSAFLIVDGVIPSNEGRGYVLRRIIRRAIRHGYQLGIKDAFFYKLVQPLAEEMGEAYPELPRAQAQVERVLRQEEERFAETLEQGMQILEQAIAQLSGKVIPGETVFRLYDTYGFPVDLTADIARERGLSLDMAGFEREMAAQRERARAAGHFTVDYSAQLTVEGSSEFTGYDHLAERSQVSALLRDGQPVDCLQAGEEGVIVLDKTSFYAESGGQVGDRGVLRYGDNVFEVRDTQKQGGDTILHLGRVVQGSFRQGDVVEAQVDEAARQATALNHTATHLLHAALRRVLGEHVVQKGSLVDPARLRFDYAHYEAPTPEQLARIESLVNEQIRANAPVETVVTDFDHAREMGAMALFGEKYGNQVRVLKMGDFSIELCGGTHARRCGDIGLFKIVSEGGIAAGVRRIEAVTGAQALARVNDMEHRLSEVAALLKTGPDKVVDKVRQLLAHNRQLEKALEAIKAKLA